MTPVRVTVGNAREYREFYDTFRIGRDSGSDLQIENKFVSRLHVEVVRDGEHWLIRDLNSSNGVYLSGKRVASVRVNGDVTIRLGVEGPFLSFTSSDAAGRTNPAPVDIQVSGSQTRFIRQAFADYKKKQRSRSVLVILSMGALVLLSLAFAIREHRQSARQLALAQSIFYSMKALDVDIANFEWAARDTNSERAMAQLRRSQESRKEAERRYNQFVTAIDRHDSKLSAQEKIVLRIARIFGECELSAPSDFQAEVDRYIKKWKSSDRLKRAIDLAATKGYTRTIESEFLALDLPPQFFYLALQESNFNAYANGIPTRKGIAKGMWQFIPETALKYDLRIGPLIALDRPDPLDERHHWNLETKAAARYIKDLYRTDAQASGLLVMACYNWGEKSVLPLVQSMPANPEERNFWKLLSKYRAKIPDETYDYVYMIVSAAVIGEDPRRFGFDFDNPLSQTAP